MTNSSRSLMSSIKLWGGTSGAGGVSRTARCCGAATAARKHTPLATDGVLRVEQVRARRVVDDDHLAQVAAHQRKVLDVLALVQHARLAEQARGDDLVDVELVKQRVRVL